MIGWRAVELSNGRFAVQYRLFLVFWLTGCGSYADASAAISAAKRLVQDDADASAARRAKVKRVIWP